MAITDDQPAVLKRYSLITLHPDSEDPVLLWDSKSGIMYQREYNKITKRHYALRREDNLMRLLKFAPDAYLKSTFNKRPPWLDAETYAESYEKQLAALRSRG